MTKPLKAQVNLSQLALIDVQERLVTAMPAEAMLSLTRNCSILLQAANLLNVPVIVTEQYPKGLGHTIAELMAFIPNVQPIEKTTFSCMATTVFSQQLTRHYSQTMLAGMESHICILQTACDLIQAGKQVFVVEDAVISRNFANKANALGRMREAGCIITNTESVVFEWLEQAQGESFKAISKLIR